MFQAVIHLKELFCRWRPLDAANALQNRRIAGRKCLLQKELRRLQSNIVLNHRFFRHTKAFVLASSQFIGQQHAG